MDFAIALHHEFVDQTRDGRKSGTEPTRTQADIQDRDVGFFFGEPEGRR
jgi:hypothetical protein